jgi:protein arginine kinase activator
MTYEDFKKIGRLGCGECYRTFRESLTPLLKRIHGATQHTGKVVLAALSEPKEPAVKSSSKASARSPKTADIDALKEKLKKAIENESYEEAARIRDQIRSFEVSPRERKGQ